MADKVYGVIEKGPTTRVTVKKSEYKGREYLHIREFYLQDGTGEWLPTQKGFTFTEGVQVTDLIALLEQAKEDF